MYVWSKATVLPFMYFKEEEKGGVRGFRNCLSPQPKSKEEKKMDKIAFHFFCAARRFLLTAVAALLITGICAVNAYAAWANDHTVNNAISTAAYDQRYPTIVTDGSGGAIIVWQDSRNVFSNIYAQRINANGNVLWTADGVAISTVASRQLYPTIVSDDSGGAIITWLDYRSSDYPDIYAQRIDANGNVLWTADGVPISTVAYHQWYPTIATDGKGGAIITWSDSRSGGDPHSDIYAQRIDANGNVLWTLDGVAISTAANSQGSPNIATDGKGGAIITWSDSRSGNYADIYAQSIDANGNVLWTPDGVVISTAANSQGYPSIVTDGSGGAIITWWDYRSVYTDIYAQRIDANGNVLWTANGVPISTSASWQEYPTIVSDGSGGAIITWMDYRCGGYSCYSDIYAQKVDANGNVLWTANGVPISTAAYAQRYPTIVTDGNGGAIITWDDYRSYWW